MKNKSVKIAILNNIKICSIVLNFITAVVFIMVEIAIVVNINRGDFEKTIDVEYTIVGSCTDNRVNEKYEVRYYSDKDEYKLYNGHSEETIQHCDYTKASMSLQDTNEELSSRDIEVYKDKDIKYKYNMPDSICSKHINYLYNQGYNLEVSISTPRLMELFMVKGNSKLRVVIYNTYTLIGEIDNKVDIPFGLGILKEELGISNPVTPEATAEATAEATETGEAAENLENK